MFSPFDPAWLFADGEQGAWYDPSDLATLYQDSAGTVPVTADGDPVGLMLDKSQGLVLGSELVTNGAFESDASGWTPDTDTTISAVGGRLRVELASGSNPSTTQQVAVPTQSWAKIMVDAFPGTAGGNIFVRVGAAAFSNNFFEWSGPPPENLEFFIFNDSTVNDFVYLTLLNTTGVVGQYGEWDNVSVKELSGNHATQSASASKRLYRTDGTLHWLEDDLFDDAITAHLPDLGANATLAYADGSGVTILTGQTISGDTNLPTVAQTYGAIYLDRPFTASETENVTAYLNKLRGA